MNFTSALTDTLKTAPTVHFIARIQQLAGASFLALSLNLPALADKVEAVGQGQKEHPANQTLLAVFTGLNVIAGVAILATIVFGVIWFLQRRDDDDEEEEEEEEELEEKAAENASKKAENISEAKAETKPEEKAASETPVEAEADAKAQDS